MSEQKKLSIICFSGDFDKLTAAFTLATGAAAIGYEVNLFFTFWGLDALKIKQGRSPVGKGFPPQSLRPFHGRAEECSRQPFELLGAQPEDFPLPDAQEQRGYIGRTRGSC